MHRSCRAAACRRGWRGLERSDEFLRIPGAAEREPRVADPPGFPVALHRAAGAHRLIAQSAAQSSQREAEARLLVEAFAFRLRAHVDASREFLVDLDRIDVVGANCNLPRARFRKLKLRTARCGAVERLDVVLRHGEFCLRQYPSRRPADGRKIRAVDLRGGRKVVRHRSAQRPFAACARHDGVAMQRPLQVLPRCRDVEPPNLAVPFACTFAALSLSEMSDDAIVSTRLAKLPLASTVRSRLSSSGIPTSPWSPSLPPRAQVGCRG